MDDVGVVDNPQSKPRQDEYEAHNKSACLSRMSTVYCQSRTESVDKECIFDANVDTGKNLKCTTSNHQSTDNVEQTEQDSKLNKSIGNVVDIGSSKTVLTWKIPPRYELKRIIGSGSYGQVSKAYDLIEHKYVAIKRINKVFDDLIDCKRILREIAILTRLNHPNVVRLLDIIVPNNLETFNELYVVLEIADSDLKKLLRSSAFLNESHVRILTFNLLLGVKYLHNMGIYHRDLKPANCLVNKDCSVKICDFGLARTLLSNGFNLCNSDDHNGSKSEDGNNNKKAKRQLTSHVVTRWYRAPEIILLQDEYTQAIDVWSVGCIFAELMNMIKENISVPSDRGPLFPGSFCFPLSPDNKNPKNLIDQHENKGESFEPTGQRDMDQLNMIFNVLGTPWENEVEYLEKEYVKKYIHMFPPRPGIDLFEKFKGSSPEAVDLLKQMLVFNPANRITISQALDHPFFDPIRNDRNIIVNTTSPCRECCCDGDEGSHVWKGVHLPFNDSLDMSEADLRREILIEIKKFHPELKFGSST